MFVCKTKTTLVPYLIANVKVLVRVWSMWPATVRQVDSCLWSLTAGRVWTLPNDRLGQRSIMNLLGDDGSNTEVNAYMLECWNITCRHDVADPDTVQLSSCPEIMALHERERPTVTLLSLKPIFHNLREKWFKRTYFDAFLCTGADPGFDQGGPSFWGRKLLI